MKLAATFSFISALSFLVTACGPSEPPKAPAASVGDGDKACTEEAKLCPDGSAVSRTGPRCEFAPCPGEGAPPPPPGEGVMCQQDAKECPDGSYVSRQPPSCAFAPCPGGSPDAAAPAHGCTREAKVCPDGSSVGRTGPSCEFAPCPGTSKPPATTK